MSLEVFETWAILDIYIPITKLLFIDIELGFYIDLNHANMTINQFEFIGKRLISLKCMLLC